MKYSTLFGALVAAVLASCANNPTVTEWVSTTYENPWVLQPLESVTTTPSSQTVVIDTTLTAQTMQGFGVAMSELGSTSLDLLSAEDYQAVLNEMFAPGKGGNFNIIRTPIGASDFALDWYSYNETAGDFAMENFSIDHDKNTLIHLIHDIQAVQPQVAIWGSPWCPPSWMKKNQHYAMRSTAFMSRMLEKMKNMESESTYMFKVVDNGLPEENQGKEGADMFICQPEYFQAYALYFKKYIQAYKQQGINLFGVMPQNEFNSDQIFPSCCWLSSSLATFIGDYLGPAMEEEGVEVMFGTMERADAAMVDTVLTHPTASKYVKRVGFQWAGKDALPAVYKNWYPKGIGLLMTEQECGDGKNDWKGAEHSWDLMKHYLNNGVSIYEYWNISLKDDCVSRWGWRQNSLVVVNEAERTYRFTPEYYVLKHASHYVQPGAKRLELSGEYQDVLAFINPDRSIAVLAGNATDESQQVSILLGENTYTASLQPKSVNTLVIKL